MAVMDEPSEFTIPLPPPLVPPPALPHGNVVFRHGAEEDGPQRDSEDIMLRKVATAVAMRFRASAGGRGMTHAQYLAALVALHEAMRAAAEGGNEAVAAELERLGLSTVSV